MFCPNCGRHLENDSEFCKHCGNKFSREGESVLASQKYDISKRDRIKEKKLEPKHNTYSVIGIILLVVGIVGLIFRIDITAGIVGKDRALRELFHGGSSVEETYTLILIVGIIALIAGCLFLFAGLRPLLLHEHPERSPSVINKPVVKTTREKIKCQNCGALNPKDSKFCNSCAKPLLA